MEFFDGAPVIEVSGRTYPVEVRYRPEFFEAAEEDDEPVDMNEAIAKAVDEIARDSRTGDILVFLPGEREIREAAEVLRKHHPAKTEILPLFSRLSAEEQDRVFERGPHRRIVLATNVAETSLTAGHPLRDRYRPRAHQALLAAAEDRPAPHRADFPGGGPAAFRAVRTRRERHRDPPVRREGIRGAAGVHDA